MKTDRNLKLNWKRAWLTIAVIAVSSLTLAQNYPTQYGTNQRTGSNDGAALSSAGRGLLTWFAPVLSAADRESLIRNNSASEVVTTGTWVTPAQADETGNAYNPRPIGNPLEDTVRGNDDPPGTVPGYLYARTIPTGKGTDPTVKNFAADTLSRFEWTVQPANVANRLARNYALYTYLPTGPTGDGAGGLLYTQRFFVYEIIYGNNRRYIDVVDTYKAGSGWVRLGNGGAATNQLFDYNGTDAIKIRLYNTVQRLSGHENDNVTAPLINWTSVYTDVPYTTVVYADAVMAVPVTGDFAATPILSQIDPALPLLGNHVVYARNNYSVGVVNGKTVTTVTGEITSANLANGNVRWKYTPLAESAFTVTQDDNSAGVTVQAPFAPPVPVVPPFRGTGYQTAAITNTLGSESVVTYTPTLNDGTYEIYAWNPGSRPLPVPTETLAQATEYRILEGVTQTVVTVNQDTGGGWVKIGTRRFAHNTALGEPLKVLVTNYSANVGDLGKFAYADAIRFVGASNLAVLSTPVHVKASVRVTTAGAPTPTAVNLIATEDGKIHCVSAAGNADGTTNVYWTYPSTADPDNSGWTDPNAVPTEDGGIATMPTGFDLSSALVQNIGGVDYLYIATRNGRVYCLEMAGRGDMDLARRVPGTTRRVWSYPDDFPGTTKRTTLGSFTGSISYGNPAAGPTIYVPTTQGRLYALDALPGGANSSKITTVRWAYPPVNQPTLGSIYGSPLVAQNHVYFGTSVAANDDRGRFFCLDWNTGAVVWQFNGTTQWDVAGGGATFVPADDFISTPAYSTAALLGGAMPDTIFVANDNRWITALDAANGNILWTTDELGSPVLSGLTVTQLSVFTGGGAGVRQSTPILMVPTSNGRFSGLFARNGVGFGSTNKYGTKLAWQYQAEGSPIYSAISVGQNWMLGADNSGFLYAFNDAGDGSGNDVGGGPGFSDVPPNQDDNVYIENFRDAKILFVTKDTFDRLRLPATDANHLTFAQATTDPARVVTRTQFDWGEYIYVLAYNFPYFTPSPVNGSTIPPVINYAFSVEGNAVRNLSIEARQFHLPNTAPLGPDGATRLDGYTILAFPIQGGGSNALSPGGASVNISASSSGVTNPSRQINIGLNPATARKDFGISNPIGLAIVVGDLLRQVGVDVDPSTPGRRINGNNDIVGTAAIENRLTATTGMSAHGKTGNVQVTTFDTSLMVLLRGPGHGVDNVRVSRPTLAWQGGRAAVTNRLIDIPFYATFYGSGKGIEDYPDTFPNESLDYPDIEAERISIVKDIFGTAENPVFGPVSLNAPDAVDPLALPFPTRNLVATPFSISVSVPMFQPGNPSQTLDSASTLVDAGYLGRLAVYVDSDGSGTLTRNGGRREAFRTFWLGSGVQSDGTFQVETPVIDFGSLAEATGYSPLAPAAAGSNYTPFPLPTAALGFDYDRNAYPYTDLFHPIVIRNVGNRNLINLRMAKFYNTGAGLNPWEVFSVDGHELTWLDGSLDLHFSSDEQYALVPVPVLQKARVGDTSGTLFSDIPVVRDNPGLGTTAGWLFEPGVGGFPDVAREVLEKGPRVGISVPMGFPVGRISQIIRIFEDANGDESLLLDANGNGLENYADPTAIIKGNVRESRATNGFTTKTAPMIDSLATTAVGNENFQLSNYQPAFLRDTRGNLVGVFASSRFGEGTGVGFDKTQPVTAEDNPEPRLYAVSMTGANPAAMPGSSPLRDLNAFAPATAVAWPNGRWWRRDVADYPTTPLATLFPGDPVLPSTAKFGGAAFPTAGQKNPFSGATNAFTYLAFVGTVQKQGTPERYGESRIFLAKATIGNNGTVTLPDPIGLPNDPGMAKGRPSVVQAGANATVFFSAAGTGQSAIQYVTFDGTNYSATQVLNVGSGFESAGGPNATGRIYTGVASPGTPVTNSNIIELSFVGKLRGRPANEIFYGRMNANRSGLPTGLAYFPSVTAERLVADAETGVFRASGVTWNRGATIQLFQNINGGPLVNVETPGTRVVDQTTGIVSFDTTLGGKAYLDPNLGTVRLANTLPSRNGQLYLTYQPRFFRISQTGAAAAAYSGPTLLFDNRLIGETSYWATNANTGVGAADLVRPARFAFTYNRAADGTQAARPYMRTLRCGIALPSAVATSQNGSVVAINVTGATSYYQVDPANGRLYFTAADENRTVSVSFTGFDDVGNTVVYPAQNYTIGLLTETSEAPIPIEQAANEAQLATFLDPFEGTLPSRRPGLFWLFWTSTRSGSPDVYFETISPRFTPKARN